jgi:hypothetical protein
LLKIKDDRTHYDFNREATAEARVVSWIVRGLLVISGIVTGWFVSKDAPNFSFIQGMVSLVVVALVVLVLAYWPARWTHLLNRRNKQD